MNIKGFWMLQPEQRQDIADSVFSLQEKCEHKTLAPVVVGDKFTHCTNCGLGFAVITPYVVKPILAQEQHKPAPVSA
jgi:hypothetical protein